MQIQWLQDTGQFTAAVLAAREMDAQVKRDIHDQHLQVEQSFGCQFSYKYELLFLETRRQSR